MKQPFLAIIMSIILGCGLFTLCYAETTTEKVSDEAENDIRGEWIVTYQDPTNEIKISFTIGDKVIIYDDTIATAEATGNYTYTDDKIKLTFVIFTFEYNVVFEDDLMNWYSGDIIKVSFKRPDENSSDTLGVGVEITNTDGEVEKFGLKDLQKMEKENALKFEKKYQGQPITVISIVDKIEGETIYNGHHMDSYLKLNGGWIIDTSGLEDIVIDLSPGDTVVVNGYLWGAFASDGYIYPNTGKPVSVELLE